MISEVPSVMPSFCDEATSETIASPKGQETRNRAKELTKKRENHYLDVRLGLIIDGTGKDFDKIMQVNVKAPFLIFEYPFSYPLLCLHQGSY